MQVVQVEGHTRDLVGDRATAGSVTYYPISDYNISLIPCAGIRVAVGNLGKATTTARAARYARPSR